MIFAAVVLVVDVHVQKCQCFIVLLLMCKFDVACGVHGVEVVCKGLCVFSFDLFQYVVHVSFPGGGFERWCCCGYGSLFQVLHKKAAHYVREKVSYGESLFLAVDDVVELEISGLGSEL